MTPLACQGLGDSPAEFARRLDIRPRKPKHRPGLHAIWPNSNIGRISTECKIIAMFDDPPRALIYCKGLIMTHERAQSTFHAVFGNSDVHHSPRGKGWWMTYSPPDETAVQLIATFDAPTKKEPRAVFSCAMLMPKQPQ
jgi:hypothetical protein